MTRYSIGPTSRSKICKRVYGFLSCAKNMSKNICQNKNKKLNGKNSQKILVQAKQSATDTLKTASTTAIQKTTAATGHLIGNKIANKWIKINDDASEMYNTKNQVKFKNTMFNSSLYDYMKTIRCYCNKKTKIQKR